MEQKESIKYDEEEIQDKTIGGIYIPYLSSRFKKKSTFSEYQKCTEDKRRQYLVLINALDIIKKFAEIIKIIIECEISEEVDSPSFLEYKNYFLFQILSTILINLVFIVLAKLRLNYTNFNLNILALFTWILVFSQGLSSVLQDGTVWAATTSFLNTCFLISLSFAFLPLQLRFLGLLGLVSSLTHLIYLIFIYPSHIDTALSNSMIWNVAGDTIFVIGLNLVSVYIRFLSDRVDQKAFFETQRYVTVLDNLQKFADKQKNLLLSVIPSFIAQDLFENLSQSASYDPDSSEDESEDEDLNRSKLYHFNDVSILFTDVMGFTDLASRCSPEKLVDILNELFETFDHLAAENNCLRIKLLGDCYYCICGLPYPRSDHAICSVNLGFQMIHAIQQVRKEHNVELDMRIGIHSGSVLCGIVGKIKWQFDIWSHDVKTANHMESSGKPGRVHVSESTLKHLSNLYEVEEVEEVQSEFLKKFNVKTFLIAEDNIRSRKRLVSVQLPEEEITPVQNDNSQYKRRSALGSTTASHDVKKFYRLSTQFKDNRLKFKYTGGEEKETFVSNLFCVLILWIFAETSYQIFAQFGWLSIILHVLCKIAVLAVFFFFYRRGRFHIISNYLHRCIFVAAVLLTMVVSDLSGNDNLGKRLITSSIFFIVAIDCFSQLKMSLKACLMFVIAGIMMFLIINPAKWDFGNSHLSWMQKEELCIIILLYLITFLFHFKLIDKTSKFLFYQKIQLEEQIKEVTVIKQQNFQLLANILPEQVANHFLQLESLPEYSAKELYAYKWPYVSVLFATIPNFKSCYDSDMETTTFNVQLLHKTISTFDDLLDEERFSQVEKIKNVGSTYMGCAGLGVLEEKEGEKQLCSLIEFALEMKRVLKQNKPEDGQEECHLRIGISYGPVVAGVIGKGKPCFDIWGNTVNEAARMDTTGKKDFIQVPKETAMILKKHNFEVVCQGMVFVKGKGEMETYNVVGKRVVDKPRVLGRFGKQSTFSFAEVVFDVVKVQRRQQQHLWKKALNRVYAGNQGPGNQNLPK